MSRKSPKPELPTVPRIIAVDPRFRLLGKYRTPRFKLRDVVFDACNGEVIIVGLTDAPIPWPIGRRGRFRSIILYGDLEKAVRRESNLVIAHWWGVSGQTVTKWRKALGVDFTTEGTSQRRREALEPRGDAMRARIPYTAERGRKISKALKGRKKPPHISAMLSRVHRGKTITPEQRQKISAALKRNGVHPPTVTLWTAREDEIVRKNPPAVAAKMTGRTLGAVYARSRVLGLPDYRRGAAWRWRKGNR